MPRTDSRPLLHRSAAIPSRQSEREEGAQRGNGGKLRGKIATLSRVVGGLKRERGAGRLPALLAHAIRMPYETGQLAPSRYIVKPSHPRKIINRDLGVLESERRSVAPRRANEVVTMSCLWASPVAAREWFTIDIISLAALSLNFTGQFSA